MPAPDRHHARAQLAAIEETAADWLGRRDGGLTPAESAELDAWLAADPRHARAWDRLERTWAELEHLARFRPAASENPDPDLPLLPRRPATTRAVGRRAWYWSAGLAAAAALAFAWLATSGPNPAQPTYSEQMATEIGGLRRFALPDGSEIELNTDSLVAVRFASRERVVTLARGEAHFTVTEDPDRPFRVRAGGVEVRAIGTAFNVRLYPGNVEVLVTEGRVSLDDATRGASLLAGTASGESVPVLAAGHRAIVSASALETENRSIGVQVTPVAPIEIARRLAWQAKRLEFEPTPLREIVAEFNRYNVHQLVLGDAAVGELSIGGSFAAGDYDTLVRLLEAGFDVTAERTPSRTTLRLTR